MNWLRAMLHRRPDKPMTTDDVLDAKVADLSQRAHVVVAQAGRTLQEARRLEQAMRNAEAAARAGR